MREIRRTEASRIQRSVIGLLLIVSVIAVMQTPTGRTAFAQATIDCSAVATPASDAGTPDTATPAATEPVPFPAEGGELTIFAAVSLANAFEQIAEDIRADNPEIDITFNFAGSQTLVTQLSEGAGADVFAAANQEQMQAATENATIAGVPVDFVSNRLTIAVPADNPAGITLPADLAQDGLLVVLAQEDVPVGRYSRESLCLMGEDTETYGDRFVASVATNIVSEEEDVRSVLTRVQLGEVDAGIVYTSDIVGTDGGGVSEVAIPDEVNVLATYPIAPVAGGDEALADAFISYVLSADGQATLAEFGFGAL